MHASVGDYLQDKGINLLLTFGDEAVHIYEMVKLTSMKRTTSIIK